MKHVAILLLIPASLWCGEEATRTIEKTLPLTGNNRTLTVCGINGSIRLTTHNGNDVRFTVRERLESRTKEGLEELKKETDVVFTQEAAAVRAGVKGPWSDADCTKENSGERRRRQWKWEGTKVEHEFTIVAPRDARLEIRTVNGSVDIKESDGSYQLATVNGAIRMENTSGTGDAKTVNGNVTAIFRRNPDKDLRFETVNGKLDLYFQPNLSADFELKTVNGKAYTDFDMTALATTAESAEHNSNGMKRVYRRSGKTSLRAGNGGIKVAANTVNGDLLIHSLAKGKP